MDKDIMISAKLLLERIVCETDPKYQKYVSKVVQSVIDKIVENKVVLNSDKDEEKMNFDIFWKEYPCKEQKQDAFRKFCSNVSCKKEMPDLMASLTKYKLIIKSQETPTFKRAPMMAARFLGKREWTSYLQIEVTHEKKVVEVDPFDNFNAFIKRNASVEIQKVYEDLWDLKRGFFLECNLEYSKKTLTEFVLSNKNEIMIKIVEDRISRYLVKPDFGSIMASLGCRFSKQNV